MDLREYVRNALHSLNIYDENLVEYFVTEGGYTLSLENKTGKPQVAFTKTSWSTLLGMNGYALTDFLRAHDIPILKHKAHYIFVIDMVPFLKEENIV